MDTDDNTENNKNNIKLSLTIKEIFYYNKINKFFNKCNKDNIDKITNIINGTSHISLRILDWFATKYSNKKQILLHHETDDSIINFFDVHISYKAQLKSYKKTYFDPFKRNPSKRKEAFSYIFKKNNQEVKTTIGQLNFLRWIIEYNILDYIEENFDDIIKEMNMSNKNDKKKQKEKMLDKSSKQDTVCKQTSQFNLSMYKKEENGVVKVLLSFNN